MPSGENFVVKSLYDSPVISWKEKELKELDDRYERTSKRKKQEIGRLEKDLRHKSKNLRLQIEANKKYSGLLEHDQFGTLVNFMCNEITHIIEVRWSAYEIKTFISCIETNPLESYDDSLKLVTLFGAGKCDFEWNINRYSDGSGGNTTILPYSSFKDAVCGLEKVIHKAITKNGVHEGMLKAKEEYNLSTPSDEEIKKYYSEKASSTRKVIEKEELVLSDRRDELKILESKSLGG